MCALWRGGGIIPRHWEHLRHALAVFALQLNACQNPRLPSDPFPSIPNLLIVLSGETHVGVIELCHCQSLEIAGTQAHLPDSNGEPLLVGYRLWLTIIVGVGH
ncbi:MAG: hypothetical protein LKI59_00160 [Bacteroidales bacterium]|nr:hypothetical protein [Bacteroidales bacterium]